MKYILTIFALVIVKNANCAFEPEYPGQFENLTIPDIQHIIHDDMPVLEAMIGSAQKYYHKDGLTPVSNFYQKVIKFLSKDNVKLAFGAIDKIKDEKARVLTYAQFAQHTTRCRHQGALETIRRDTTHLNLTSRSESEMLARFTDIYTHVLELLEKGKQFGIKYNIAFWPDFHQAAIDFMKPELHKLLKDVEFHDHEIRKMCYQVLYDDMYFLLVPFLNQPVTGKF